MSVAEQDKVMEVKSITGWNDSQATFLLETHDWDVSSAVQSFIWMISRDNQDNTTHGIKRPLEPDNQSSNAPAPKIPRVEQQNEQEEQDEDVPAPIPIKRETLIQPHERHNNENRMGYIGRIYKPLYLVFDGSFAEAKQKAQKEKKWLLVSILNTNDTTMSIHFNSIWMTRTIMTLIQSYFIFYYRDISSAEDYRRFYRVDGFPHTAVLHPSGEQRLFYSGILSRSEVSSGLQTIIDESVDPFKTSFKSPLNFKRLDSAFELTEEEQLELAISSSLVETEKQDSEKEKTVNKKTNTLSPDTKLSEDDSFDCIIIDPPRKKGKKNEIVSKTPKGYLEKSAASCEVKIRLPDGKMIGGYFDENNQVQDIYDFLSTHSDIPEDVKNSQFVLYTFPKIFLEGDLLKQTLKDASTFK